MLCCVQVTQLVEFLIEQHGELFEEEVAGLAAAPAEESPAPGAEAETTEVRQGRKQRHNQSLPLRRWDCCRRDKQGHPPASSFAKV